MDSFHGFVSWIRFVKAKIPNYSIHFVSEGFVYESRILIIEQNLHFQTSQTDGGGRSLGQLFAKCQNQILGLVNADLQHKLNEALNI
jgi:hypothetical protein